MGKLNGTLLGDEDKTPAHDNIDNVWIVLFYLLLELKNVFSVTLLPV